MYEFTYIATHTSVCMNIATHTSVCMNSHTRMSWYLCTHLYVWAHMHVYHGHAYEYKHIYMSAHIHTGNTQGHSSTHCSATGASWLVYVCIYVYIYIFIHVCAHTYRQYLRSFRHPPQCYWHKWARRPLFFGSWARLVIDLYCNLFTWKDIWTHTCIYAYVSIFTSSTLVVWLSGRQFELWLIRIHGYLNIWMYTFIHVYICTSSALYFVAHGQYSFVLLLSHVYRYLNMHRNEYASDTYIYKYSLLHLECHLISIFNLNLRGLFSTKRGKRDPEN